jgi:transposase-like protein/DNA-directed RNA polymerase subunit M/transcription elongation factor TFIIS
MPTNLLDKRQLKAVILQKNVSKIDRDTYAVKSQSGKGTYIVTRQRLEWSCQCPDYRIRGVVCKHIRAVVISQSLNVRRYITEAPQTEVEDEWSSELSCPKCGSTEIVKRGRRETVNGPTQRFGCKSCGNRFVVNAGFERMKATPQAVTVSLDLFFKGISTRKIVDHLQQFYGIEVTHVAILKWIRKYSQLIKEYVKDFQPQTSGIWHTDEMTLNIDGQMKWLWNCMDHKTRFLLASQISTKREVSDAQLVFALAKAATANKPDYVITDGLHAYSRAFNKEFYTAKMPRPQHVRLPSIRERPNNNEVERLHGTIRERTKTMRGLDNEKTAFVDGFQSFYNYLRPHMGLDGKTPAEAAGVNLKLEGNKWKALIGKASKSRVVP